MVQGHRSILLTLLLVSVLLISSLWSASAATQNWAQGMNYTYNVLPNANYPDSGGQLTDGEFGASTRWGDANLVAYKHPGWVATKEPIWEITVDLTTQRSIGQIRATFLRDSAGAVFHPKKVAVAVSSNGTDWQTVGSKAFARTDVSQGSNLTTFDVPAVEARYVRLTAEKDGEWLFIDEIEVLSEVEAAKLPTSQEGYTYTYNIQPDPQWSDTGAQLLDGVYGPITVNDPAWVATKTDEPWVITVDLKAIRSIEQIGARFLRDSGVAVRHPKRFAVAVSSDGSDWTTVGIRDYDRAEFGNLEAPTTTFTQLNVDARYVRLTIEKDGQWLFIDEIDIVTGTSDAVVAPAAQPSAVTEQTSQGYTYTYNIRPDGNYPDHGGQLMDGKFGAVTLRDPAWVASRAAGPWVITVDLQEVKFIDETRATFLRDGDGAVYHPASLEVAVSKNGTDWTNVGARSYDRSDYGSKLSQTTTFSGLDVEARYVRFTIQKDFQWVFLDELEVLDETAATTWLADATDVDFTNHGVVGEIAEFHGLFATNDASGRQWAVAVIQDNYNSSARDSFLVIDPATGDTEQFWYKEGDYYAGDLWSTIKASTGKFYTMFGPVFLEFDLDKRDWTFAQNIGGLGITIAEGLNGKIYIGQNPTNTLWEFDPIKRELKSLGRLDQSEKYTYTLATDKQGWVYAGIGTVRSGVAALHPATGEVRQLALDSERVTGRGEVFYAEDGKVYGRMSENGNWFHLENGERYPVAYPGYKVSRDGKTDTWPNGERIVLFDLIGRKMAMQHGLRSFRVVDFAYVSSGARITSLVAGPEGRVHGSTAHPMRYFTYDPVGKEIVDNGRLPNYAGGNITNFAVVGDIVYAGAYNGGYLYSIDTTKPWSPNSVLNPNPIRLAMVEGPIARPRPVLAHPNGNEVIMAGYPGFGLVGGGMLVYDIRKKESTLILAEDLLPGHSTMSMRFLPNGNLIGATSVETPGGGTRTATDALLYIMDWESKEITYQMVPLVGQEMFGVQVGTAREINSIEVDANGMVYGIASDAQFFVFDPMKREVIHRTTFRQYGSPSRMDQTLFKGADGRVYALMGNALLRFNPDTFAPEPLVSIPVGATAGYAIIDGRLYFASGSNLWSMSVEGLVE